MDWPRTDLVGGHRFTELVELDLPERADQPLSVVQVREARGLSPLLKFGTPAIV